MSFAFPSSVGYSLLDIGYSRLFLCISPFLPQLDILPLQRDPAAAGRILDIQIESTLLLIRQLAGRDDPTSKL